MQRSHAASCHVCADGGFDFCSHMTETSQSSSSAAFLHPPFLSCVSLGLFIVDFFAFWFLVWIRSIFEATDKRNCLFSYQFLFQICPVQQLNKQSMSMKLSWINMIFILESSTQNPLQISAGGSHQVLEMFGWTEAAEPLEEISEFDHIWLWSVRLSFS